MSALSILFQTSEARNALRAVDSSVLDRQVNGRGTVQDQSPVVEQLRVAAIASFADLFAEQTLDDWLRNGSRNSGPGQGTAEQCFANWQGYLNAVAESEGTATPDDVLFFAVSGFIVRKPHEVRDALRRSSYRSWLAKHQDDLPRLPWVDRVRTYISLAILLVIRQETRTDIESAGQILRQLANSQAEFESNWLEQQQNQRRNAVVLLGFYHLARAVMRVAEFLLAGTVSTEGRPVNDVLAELRRLLVRAEEYLSLSGDSEKLLWLLAVGIGLISLRESSIWIQSRGISEQIDRLLDELTQSGRPYPVFSLLPSQQEALRQSFLDRHKLAIVLQMPTSAGKTLLAEFAIAQTFDVYRTQTRVAYVVPTRALATQVRRTLAEDLGPLGIKVSAAGGAFEEDPYELRLLADSEGVVVTTPEKLDLMLRAHPDWFTSLRLIVVDEAHLLHDGERGARLELLLANLRREQPEARLLLLTPFMENANQIAAWLSRERGHSINVQWRPSRVLLGMGNVIGARGNWRFRIDWTDPYSTENQPTPLEIPIGATKHAVTTNSRRALFLARKLKPLGTVLTIFSASPSDAEQAASEFAAALNRIPAGAQSAQLRLAVGLARHEFGQDSRLASCLECGVAYHHSSLSPILRYLIEDQIRAKKIGFVAATSTLAQGMNFPVACILVHSVHKPRGRGDFSSAEFWNIAGRAGRVGMVERGLVIFTDPNHQRHLNRYASELRNVLTSALLTILPDLRLDRPLKDQYRDIPALRPFIQYLAHAAASSTPDRAITNLEEIIQQSLANQQVQTPASAQKLRSIARTYLQQLAGGPQGMLKTADETGLATFSFNELYAKLRNDEVLRSGPTEVLGRREEGFERLIEALRWLPEMNLALGFGEGEMDVEAVAKVVDGWIAGRQVHEIAGVFPGDDDVTKRRKTAQYLYGTVSQTISWGAHAYLRGWLMSGNAPDQLAPEDRMLPAYMAYGVHSPEAAVASLLGVPRAFAEAIGEQYRENSGPLTPDTARAFQSYVESADEATWDGVIARAGVRDVQPADIRSVFRQMQGLAT
jgi:helicase